MATPDCETYQRAIDVLARPWTGLLLWALQPGPRRFGELETAAVGVSAKVLSQRLRTLCTGGLVERSVEAGPPTRVTYKLTRKGRAFGKVARALEAWGRELTRGADGVRSRGVAR